MSRPHRQLEDVLADIRSAITTTVVADPSTDATSFLVNDRHDLLQHLGVYVDATDERATGERSAAVDGHDFVEDIIQVTLRYGLRGPDGQIAAMHAAIAHARGLRRLVTSADPAARVRFDRERRTFEDRQKGWYTVTQTYRSKRTGYVGRC